MGIADHVDDEADYHAGVEYLAEQDEQQVAPMDAQELAWAIDYHVGDKTQLLGMLQGVEERHLHPKYRTLLRNLVRGHERAIELLQEELRRKQIEDDQPPTH